MTVAVGCSMSFRAARGRPLKARLAGGALLTLALMAAAAPWMGTVDPYAVDTTIRNLGPLSRIEGAAPGGAATARMALFGTDALGRDLYSRTLYGARVSLGVGFLVAALACGVGLAIGLIASASRWFDAIVMRVMDGLMAVPAVVLAFGLMTAWRPGFLSVVAAIVVTEIPRVARLVRATAVATQAKPFVLAAAALGLSRAEILIRHVMPSVYGLLAVQGAFVFASAMLTESALSFVGLGVSPDTPSWGGVMAEGRQWFRLHPVVILAPGAFLAATVLAVNAVGDARSLRVERG